MIVPFGDDLEAHGLMTPELLKAIVEKQWADTELAMALGRLPRWYRERIEALAARGSRKIWTDTSREATALAAPLDEPIAGGLGWLDPEPDDPYPGDPDPKDASKETAE
jgi:hypothetical protein